MITFIFSRSCKLHFNTITRSELLNTISKKKKDVGLLRYDVFSSAWANTTIVTVHELMYHVFTKVLTDFFLLYSLDLAFLTFFSFSVALHIYFKENSEHDTHCPATDVILHEHILYYIMTFLRLLYLFLCLRYLGFI